MNRGNTIRLGIIALLVALALSEVLIQNAPSLQDVGPGNNTLGMRLGLDLSGGIHLVYEADLSQIGEEDPATAVDGAMDIINRRVDAHGVSEPVIQKQGANRISIQLPGIRDMEAAIKFIGQTAQLDYREVLTNAQGNPAIGEIAFILENLTLTQEEKNDLTQSLQSKFDEFREIDTFGGAAKTLAVVFGTQVPLPTFEQELHALGYDNTNVKLVSKVSYWDTERYPQEPDDRLWVPAMATDSNNEEVQLTGAYLTRNNRVVMGQTTNEPKVSFEFDDEGAKLFEQITARLIGKPLGILLDDKLVSWPTVRSQIGRNGVIENIDLEDAQDLTKLLNAGALPVPLEGPIIREDIDPTLGADSIRKSLIAGVIGLALVLAFMVFYYRLPGVLASCALLIYGILVLAAFKLIPVTLTLAGIAAFILSIGMAVDANVLIFERLKEELRAGRTLGGAIEAGFNRAWTAIRDSNLSTLITCAILYWMGSILAEPRVMGFALTLAIGVALSMFTAIVITRTFLRLFVGTRTASRLSLFGAQRFEQTQSSREQE